MESSHSIWLLGNDDCLLTIDICATSWGFTGKTQVYTSFEELKKWAGEIKRFALGAGQTAPVYASGRDSFGFLEITISVLDSVGHWVGHIALEPNRTLTFENKHKLEVEFRIEPSAVDKFLLELITLPRRVKEKRAFSVSFAWQPCDPGSRSAVCRVRSFVTVCDFSVLGTCYAELNERLQPVADV
jgi:hypothetical protein